MIPLGSLGVHQNLPRLWIGKPSACVQHGGGVPLQEGAQLPSPLASLRGRGRGARHDALQHAVGLEQEVGCSLVRVARSAHARTSHLCAWLLGLARVRVRVWLGWAACCLAGAPARPSWVCRTSLPALASTSRASHAGKLKEGRVTKS
jgi:hypothetical protein